MAKKELGRYSKQGKALLLDLRDQTQSLLKDANVDKHKAQQVANELMRLISAHWGGQMVYIIKVDSFLIDERDIQIYKEFNGHNHAELAQKYDLAVAYIYRIIKQMYELERKRNQHDLFDQ